MEKIMQIIANTIKSVFKTIFSGGNRKKYVQKARDNSTQIQVGDIKNGK